MVQFGVLLRLRSSLHHIHQQTTTYDNTSYSLVRLTVLSSKA
jgi:hypothetical protein